MANEVVWDAGGFAELMVLVTADIARRALKVESAAKQLAPVDTGRLRASITHEIEVTPFEVTGRVGTNVVYAIYQELGTSRHPPHPFLRPALDSAAE